MPERPKAHQLASQSSLRRRRGRSSSSSSGAFSASTFGLDVMAWLTRWSASLGCTLQHQLAQNHVAQLAIGDDVLEVLAAGPEVGQQVGAFLVPVDRVG